MTTNERVKLAKCKTRKVIDALRTLLQVRMNNELILYSDLLRKQVGKSYAAHAFNVFRGALYESELVRICALWDGAPDEKRARERNSIPAIGWLLKPNDVLKVLQRERAQYHTQSTIVDDKPRQASSDAQSIEPVLRRSQLRTAEVEGRKTLEALTRATQKIAEIERSELHIALKRFRNIHVAHALDVSALAEKADVAVAKYGQERELFDKSVDVMNDLYFGVCNGAYAWNMAREESERYSKALLSRCRLNITE